MNIEQMIIDGNRRLSKTDAELLLRACEDTKARNIVEIGSMDGASSLVLGHYAKANDGHLFCIEPAPKGKWRANIANYGLQQHVSLIMAASPWVPMASIRTPVDVLFIDGNHKTRWCLGDYHFWEPFVRTGGIIVFHDYCGAAGYKEQIRRAISIILETDGIKLELFGKSEGSDKGAIAYRKVS